MWTWMEERAFLRLWRHQLSESFFHPAKTTDWILSGKDAEDRKEGWGYVVSHVWVCAVGSTGRIAYVYMQVTHALTSPGNKPPKQQ